LDNNTVTISNKKKKKTKHSGSRGWEGETMADSNINNCPPYTSHDLY